MLLDRSYSMTSRWSEALSSINIYVGDLAKQKLDTRIALAAFDNFNGLDFKILRAGVPAKSWEPVSNNELAPRGGTPLYDAFRRIFDMAKDANERRSVIVVMTDGEENASVATTVFQVRNMVDAAKARDWQVVFLGADFDATREAGIMNLSPQSVLNTRQGFYASAANTLSGSTATYGLTGRSMSFTDSDKAQALGRKSAKNLGQGS